MRNRKRLPVTFRVMKQSMLVCAGSLAFLATVGVTQATVITLTDAQQMAMGRLGWDDGTPTLNSKTDIPGDGVQYNITLGTAGDGKLAYGNWSGNYGDWSAYSSFSLKFELVSSTGDQADKVEVANFFADKSWNFRQMNGWWPEIGIGESVTVNIDFSNTDGGIDVSTLLDPVNGAGWQVITKDGHLLGETIVLNVYPTTAISDPLMGDANLDGDVDVFQIDGKGDAQILTSNLGMMSGAVWGDGDFNGDGDVDVFQIDGRGDAQLLTANLGASLDVGSNAVPEPSTFALLAMGVIGLVGYAWRRHKSA